MAEKRFKAEQIVVMLREAEIQMAKGLDLAQACRNIGQGPFKYVQLSLKNWYNL